MFSARAIALVLLIASAASAQRYYEISSITDGDTVRLVGVKKAVRILGINAPESSTLFGKRADPEGPAATEELRKILAGQKVRLGFEPKSRVDRCNDRLLNYLFLPDGTNVSVEMVRRGMALYEPRFYTRYKRELQVAEREAKEAKRGLWASKE